MITIQSNGSKWYGEQPDSIERLIEVLSEATLDPTFEQYGNFVIDHNDGVRLFGNFADRSHVFNIDGEREELQPVIDAIRRNQQTEQYKVERARRLPPNRKVKQR